MLFGLVTGGKISALHQNWRLWPWNIKVWGAGCSRGLEQIGNNIIFCEIQVHVTKRVTTTGPQGLTVQCHHQLLLLFLSKFLPQLPELFSTICWLPDIPHWAASRTQLSRQENIKGWTQWWTSGFVTQKTTTDLAPTQHARNSVNCLFSFLLLRQKQVIF